MIIKILKVLIYYSQTNEICKSIFLIHHILLCRLVKISWRLPHIVIFHLYIVLAWLHIIYDSSSWVSDWYTLNWRINIGLHIRVDHHLIYLWIPVRRRIHNWAFSYCWSSRINNKMKATFWRAIIATSLFRNKINWIPQCQHISNSSSSVNILRDLSCKRIVFLTVISYYAILRSIKNMCLNYAMANCPITWNFHIISW